MKKVIHICDKCNVEKIYDKPNESEFRAIKFLIGKIGSEYVSDGNYSSSIATKKELFICKECQIKLGISTDKNKDDTDFYKQPTLIDKVFELFTEIADELGYVKGE